MNKVILMGRLTADPELRYTTNGNLPVCRFKIAVDRGYAKQGEERQADFFNITAWRGTAEFCSKYFKKGMRVLIEGSIQNRTWDDNNGVKHYADDIIASNVFFADGKKQDDNSSYNMPPFPQPVSQNPVGNQSSNQSNDDGFFPISDDDDDLPF